MSSSNKLDLDLLGLVFNHLVLPPDIPEAQDSDIDAVSRDIVMRMIRATNNVMNISWDVPWQEAYQNLQDSLEACLELNRGQLERNSLLQQFQRLCPGQILILYLNEQNAGLLVRRDMKDDQYVIFESLEASAASCKVLAAGHAVQWDFPGRSARIALDDFTEESFQQSLASFLEQASMESLYSLQASTRKAGVSVEEIRDTTDPALITQMLMSLLEAVGSHYQAPVLRKQVRDDVNLIHTNIPWRRLPFWLILRVAAQRQLCFALGAEQGQAAYKFLMAILLAELLDDSAERLSPHKVVCLRTKLARRMAKLEMNQEKIKLDKDENANMKVEATWDSFKRSTTRRVPPLPDRAPPDSLELTLPNSGSYLDDILSTKLLRPPALGSVTLPNPLDQSIQKSQQFTDGAFDLAALEERIERDAKQPPDPNQNHENHCLELESQMENVFNTSVYDSSPEQNSAMILAIFTLWVELDKSAIAACQLLADHAPVFRPELLDALQLPTKWAMERLQKIQEYLADRHTGSAYGSILEIHNQNSFALRYIAASKRLRSLEHRIQQTCDHAREKKKEEHERLCNEYDKHTKGVMENNCICVRKNNRHIVDDDCKRCQHQKRRKSMKIMVQEALLPEKNPERGTILFELEIPECLSAYRGATWQILSTLAHPYRPDTEKPEVHLQTCEPLKRFIKAKVNRLSLASKIKCFEKTHYKFRQGKAPLTRVLLPFAAAFKLYDSTSHIWVEDLAKPLTLEHLCGIQTPRILLPILPKALHPATIVDGPSSYEIQANQAVVSKDIPVQAFSAYQKLLAGKMRRWPNILVELSSSNLNLSDEDTIRVICQLASQAGPRLPNKFLRAVHEVFEDLGFTTRLTNILENMLESIRTNWREHNIMQLVIILALRLHCLSVQSLGTTILSTARKYLLEWVSELRGKAQDTKDSTEAQQYASYGLYAALLCRRTFTILLSSEDRLSQEDLSAWIQASIAVQENTLHDLSRLSATLRDLLFHDAKMGYHLKTPIMRAMTTYRHVVGAEILGSWSSQFPHPEKACSSWAFLPRPQNRWIVATTPGPFPQRLHFNYIEGHLLVNGKPRSKLPLNIADDDAVRFIFGNQHLLTYPSNRPGMSHRLVQDQTGHQVHFGLRNEQVVIRAIKYNHRSKTEETWEYIPEWRLSKPGTFDLPAELVRNCGHWLNLNTRCLDIRRGTPDEPAFWITRPKDWILDVPRRRASRGGSQLVDPQSETFTQIADIFCDFEQADKLTVFQPQNSAARLTVELKHLDLHFEVNRNHLLWCQRLNAEIDTNQDAGTWYGLRSKIVMRESKTRSRSIIVPLGRPVIRRNGSHVDVRIQGVLHYARFMIDSIIGRLSCSPEPRLIYTKALYHAITSFCLPDALTGRTGSSEALTVLRSGAAQPWAPVTKAVNDIFEAFDKLVPRREYYPPHIQRIQKIIWDPDLTSSIQCDGYRQAIEAIKAKSNNLQVFTTDSGFELRETNHLCRRGGAQRQIYDPFLDVEASYEFVDAVYFPRDRQYGVEAAQVYQIARVVLSRCSIFHMGRTLRSILESFQIIGGFSTPDTHAHTSYAGPLISQIEDPINENWGELVDFCRNRANKASLLFRLGLLAFHNKANMDTIQSLATFYLVAEIKEIDPPLHAHFMDFPSRGPPSVDLLESIISSTYPELQPIRGKKGQKNINWRAPIEHNQASTDMTMEMLKPVPSESLEDPPHLLIDISSAWDRVKPEWQRRYANMRLSRYITQVDKVLVSLCRVHDTTMLAPWIDREPDLMIGLPKRGPAPEVVDIGLLGIVEKQPQNAIQPHPIPNQPTELAELGVILRVFEQTNNNLRKQYAGDLRQSLAALETAAGQLEPETLVFSPDISVVSEELRHAQNKVRDFWTAITAALTADDNRDRWLKLGSIRPLSTATEVLKLLRSTGSFHFGARMKEAIVSYGVAITNAQHKIRIQRAFLRRDHQALHDELRQAGHKTWKPIEELDWLLLEIDSDILIRAEQVAVARAIIDPTLGNGVLQLRKTSCIIPMVAAVLADGQSVSRVVVPKALLMQTAQTMQSRLGGLVGREVIHVPFSRRTSTEEETLDLFADLHHETRHRHGVMLTCAEHLLSYKLFGWQKFVDSKTSTADQMITFQKWLDMHCRDVLDECDFTLSVKTQLNYPSGPEMPVDFHPHRWHIAQELLGLVASHLRRLRRQHPKGIQVTSRREGEHFPAVQFLRIDTEDALHDFIMDDICSGRLTLLRPAQPQFRNFHQKRSAIREVLCGSRISDKSLRRAANLFANPNLAGNALLLVRGLLLHRIIVLCLGKRWNVQYGLHPDRNPIAVPYEAKGKPSEQAEYGHPDVTILFTCLSFYYAGLTQDQLTQGVQHILQSNDPAAQYEWWTSTCTELPASLRRWNVINADDKGQMEQLWRFIRWNRIAINYYLNHFVFPVYARQFEVKLQACSWDIPICPQTTTQLTRTTGFSGTNDNRLMLPLTIRQRDLPELQHTNAEVLSYLLQKRNREFNAIANKDGKRFTEKDFLRDLKGKGVTVLIDAGAYISEMGNEDLAQTWLEVDSDAQAVVYFRNDNRAWVHYRGKTKEDVPLLATPLAENMSECNVFLDEGHTRGVDLRLPRNARGAVTLALKLTKDHAVQAAMRLRQLKTTQSVCFYGPPEVEQNIKDFHDLGAFEGINSSHVVSWLLEQTCRSVEDLQGLYVAQGMDFCRRTDAIWHCKDFMTNDSERQKLLRVLKQSERKTLKDSYGPVSERTLASFDDDLVSLQLRSYMDKLVLTSKDQQGRIQAGALEEVEQEREVEAQVEQVRQVEKRKIYDALEFPGTHPEIVRFAWTGKLPASLSAGFEHAFAFVGRATVAKRFGVHETSSKLFVSREFANTVQVAPNSQEGDNFLRPVEWILWSPKTETALVVIPEEAEEVLRLLRAMKAKSHTHLIAYAAPVTKAMLHFNSLDFYSFPQLPKGNTFPERIKIELGILAGRLYVDQSEWKPVVKYVRESETGAVNDPNKIAADPAGFLLEWLTIRRKTVDVLHTPMGYICTGREMEIVGSSEGSDGED
ncbi:hypothetical protein E0Z10_g9910 [Xylaria hypoxylon]|uniref:ubiquitinyl hydrolase 1 n=1 Tax=Xylaria hypoxylon TaxID=37992 RepID=A0A4Z0Y4Z5_9PEZI|nr:hypothetical protein E0Z10_g9910 [Xylaria hypoxylon]